MPNPKLCPELKWKISSVPTSLESQQVLQNTYSNGLIGNATQAFNGFSDLYGTTLGEAIGTGPNAKITLDTDAAGYGWFIDSTPLSNDEFLPTADANIWKAKAGSAAEGKMDMLSVLLHEYGHSLGLEHSTATSDAMAAIHGQPPYQLSKTGTVRIVSAHDPTGAVAPIARQAL